MRWPTISRMSNRAAASTTRASTFREFDGVEATWTTVLELKNVL